MERLELIDVALGEKNADLVIRHGNLVNVNTREVYKADVAIKGSRIAYVGDARHTIGGSTLVVDAEKRFIVPALMDAHFHMESSILTFKELARILIPRGVTTIMEDPHEMANVLGVKGIELMFEEARRLPLRVLLRVPGQVPAVKGVETTGSEVSLEETKELLEWEKAVCLAGDVNASLILNKDEAHLRKIDYAIKLGKTIGGQMSAVNERELNAFVDAGPEESHISRTGEEMLNMLRAGMKAIIREPILKQNFDKFIWLAEKIEKDNLDSRHCLLCIDDKFPDELVREGHMDNVVRLAIKAGFDPLTAIQMATINIADHYHLSRDLGSLCPGKIADIIILDDLKNFQVDKVLVEGKVVAEKGRLLIDLESYRYPDWSKRTVNLKRKVTPSDFDVSVSVEAGSVKVKVMRIGEIKKEVICQLEVREGKVMPNIERDILNVAVVERHKGTGNIGRGFVTGFGIDQGAIASSVSHDNHNITVVGASTEDMAICVNKLAEIGGGLIAVRDAKKIGQVELPIAGLLSEDPYEEVVKKLEGLKKAVRKGLHCKTNKPLVWLTEISLPNKPELGLTDKGLFDVKKYELTSLIVKE